MFACRKCGKCCPNIERFEGDPSYTLICSWKKKRNILVALSENNWIFFFGTTENWSNSSSFLKVSCNMKSETAMKFSYSVILISTAVLILSGSFNYVWFCNFNHWSFGKYWFTELCRTPNCWHISLYSFKNYIHY